MDLWQRDYLERNLPVLIGRTECIPKLFAILRSKGMFDKSDVDHVMSFPTRDEKAGELYRLAEQRTNGFEYLTIALHQTNQTGAYEIFAQGYSWRGLENPVFSKIVSNAADVNKDTTWSDLSDKLQQNILSRTILLMGSQIQLKQLVDKLAIEVVEKMFRGDSLIELLNPNSDINIRCSIPEPPKYYVPRRLKPRRKLDPKLFARGCNDVFVFKSIEWHKLSEIANRNSTDRSSNQTNHNHLSVRFILLEYERDFNKICEIGGRSKQPVHLLEYNEEGDHVFWLRTQGNISMIQEHLVDTLDTISEAEFIENCLSSSNHVCISDTPGMGKTILLANLGRGIVSKEPDSIVLYVVLREFVEGLGREFDVEHLCELLCEQSSSNTIVTKTILKCLLQAENVKVELLFDGFDEVLSDQRDTTRKMLRKVQELKGTRVIVTTRPHLRKELEELLGTLAHNILAFQESDQIEFLVKYWEEEGGGGVGGQKERLTEFANLCLEHLKKTTTDFERNFAGIPLQCKLLADVHSENALKYSNPGSKVSLQDFGVSVSITSIFELYNRLIEMRFKGREHLFQYHVHLAIEHLFPDWAKKLKLLPASKVEYPVEEICKVGVMEAKCVEAILRFIHRTLAEFLVAKYISTEWSKWRNFKFWEFFLTEQLTAVEGSESPVGAHGFGEWVQIESASFRYPVIVYFINAFLKQRSIDLKTFLAATKRQQKSSLSTISEFVASAMSLVTGSSSEMREVEIPANCRGHLNRNMLQLRLLAAVQHNFDFLTTLLVTFNEQFVQLPLSQFKNILLLAAKHGDKESLEQVVRMCAESELVASHTFQHSSGDPDLMLTPLHVAVHVGKFKLVEYLVNNCGYGGKLTPAELPCLVHMAVYKSRLNNENVSEKAEIIKFLNNWNSGFIHERLPKNGTTPLLQFEVHLDLVNLLMELGADVNHLNEANESVLYTVLKTSMSEQGRVRVTPTEYEQLISKVREKGFAQFNARANGRSLVHMAVSSFEFDRSVMESLFENESSVINVEDDNRDTVLFEGVRAGRSLLTLQNLISLGADIRHKNCEGETVLHMAAKHGNLEAVKMFSGCEHLVNAKDNQMCTPLHCAVMQRSEVYEEIQCILLEKGSDVNSANSTGNNPLVHGIVEGKGVSMRVIREMEAQGIELSGEKASLALRHHIIRSGSSSSDWLQVANLLKGERGALLSGNEGENPWDLEEVRENMISIEDSIQWTDKLVEEARKHGLLDLREGLSSITSLPGSYESLMCSLLAANQTKGFQLMRQSLLSHVLRKARFISPPPGVNEFLWDSKSSSRVLIIQSEDVDVTTQRIRDTLNIPIVNGIPQMEQLNKGKTHAIVVVCSAQEMSRRLDRVLDVATEKIIFVVRVDEGNLSSFGENVTLTRDEIEFGDVSAPYRQKLFEIFDLFMEGSGQRKSVRFSRNVSSAEIIALINIRENQDHLLNLLSDRAYLPPFKIFRRNLISRKLFHYFVRELLVFRGVGFEEVKSLAKLGQRVCVSGDEMRTLEAADYVVLEDDSHLDLILEKCERRTVLLLEVINDKFLVTQSHHRGTPTPFPCAEGNPNDCLNLAAYFHSVSSVNLLQAEFSMWPSFVKLLSEARPNENVAFGFLAQETRSLSGGNPYVRWDDSRMLYLQQFFHNSKFSYVANDPKNKVLNIVLGVFGVVADFNLCHSLEPAINDAFKKMKNIRFWTIVMRDVHLLEEAFCSSAHELRSFSKEEQSKFISASWGQLDQRSLSLEKRASAFVEIYESQFLAKVPVISPASCYLLDTFLPREPLENPSFYTSLIAKCFKQREYAGSQSVREMCELVVDDFLRLAGGRWGCPSKEVAEGLKIILITIAVHAVFPEELLIFVGVDVDGSFAAAVEKKDDDGDHGRSEVFREMASYLVALLFVDESFAKFVKRVMLVWLLKRILVGRARGSVADYNNVCFFIDSLLLQKRDDDSSHSYFQRILAEVVVECELNKRHNDMYDILGFLVRFHNILRLLTEVVDVGGKQGLTSGNRDRMRGRMKELVKCATCFGEVQTVQLVCKLYLEWCARDGMGVVFSDQTCNVLKFALIRGDSSIVALILEDVQLRKYPCEGLLYLCTKNSLFDPAGTLAERRKVIQLLMAERPECLERKELCSSTTFPLHARNVDVSLLKQVISLGVEPNRYANYKDTVLHLASRYLTPEDYHELVEFLVSVRKTECFTFVSAHSFHGKTVLEDAVVRLQLLPETVDILKKAGVVFNRVYNRDSCAIRLAIEGNQNAGVIGKLIEYEAGWTDENENLPLHRSAQSGNLCAVRVLLGRRGWDDVNCRNIFKKTPLHFLCEGEGGPNRLEILRILLKLKADANARDSYGHTPLHRLITKCTTTSSWLQAIEKLVKEGGADICIKNDRGLTLLHLAAEYLAPDEYSELIRWIVENDGCRALCERSRCGATPLHFAVWNLKLSEETLDLMLSYGQINDVDGKGESVLFYAIRRHWDPRFIELLLEKGADWRWVDLDGNNVLHVAALHGNYEAMRIFVGKGSDVKWENKFGNTPLHNVYLDSLPKRGEIVNLLVENGAELRARNLEGRIPSDLGSAYNMLSIRDRFLIKASRPEEKGPIF